MRSSAVYVNQTNLNAKLSTQLVGTNWGPAKNMGGSMTHHRGGSSQ